MGEEGEEGKEASRRDAGAWGRASDKGQARKRIGERNSEQVTRREGQQLGLRIATQLSLLVLVRLYTKRPSATRTGWPLAVAHALRGASGGPSFGRARELRGAGSPAVPAVRSGQAMGCTERLSRSCWRALNARETQAPAGGLG